MNNSSQNVGAGIRYRVVHETRSAYRSAVTLSQQYLHLTPRTFQYQGLEWHQIRVSPADKDNARGKDYFGNDTRHIAITIPHKLLFVHAESTVVLLPRPGLSAIMNSPPWETLPVSLTQGADAVVLEACRYLYASPHVSCSTELERFARISYTPGRPHLEAALALTQRIFDEFEFDAKATEISTPLEEVMKGRRGVCQDFAQLMIGCLRSLGLPARYVSGYILTHPPAGQPRMVGADASHAWVSVFCPSLGWVDFDPTNRCLVQSEHITLGWGRDFSDVTPMRGVVLGGGKQALEVRVTVSPLGAAGGAVAAQQTTIYQ